ncbi:MULTISPECIES: enoyl-CoA hydratase/isomerase family protein [unclassified Paenibacillus]|uniref:enoyl-CoA hydratase/isomerase family protein n=1 Tax=unclassified Paenibacillus TaxID=185978 RepID=UPI001AE90B4A|nr:MULTISPECIES: enoyl-CoA hydratase/isomerase family protein [unclassified Paenibacillus]MBP1156981.1 enoyl-CoA hydratase/carnithine racemase [Paenibacillus sp. PvP091]MBP1172280.1 enoyl-CoA hydratase/carnithine racemase [Paenibacillus sp. PvR098]MBP2438661.1 enoyl-CoA hydratase/carnithine racemase [Paenibacillus sp. PvP052]
MSTNLTLIKENGIAEIHLHVNKTNSYSLDFYKELNAAIDDIRFDSSIKVAILMSDVPKFFSAGADINFLKSAEPRFKTQFCLFCNETLDKMARSPQIFIACLEGHTVGGGLEMALGCDLRFMGDQAGKIGLPEISLGVLAGTGGTQRLARLIGFSRALDMNITGKTITPQEALQMGLVNDVFPQEQTREKVLEYARKIVNSASYAAANIKLSIMNGKEMPLNVAVRYEGELQNLLFRSEDAKEGLSSFLEKREANWMGA